VPLLPFYPAIAVATAVGGTRPGVVAVLLSTIAANFLLRAPELGFVLDGITLFQMALFTLVCALIIAPIIMLNHAMDRLSFHAESSIAILEEQPVGIVAVDREGRITLLNGAVERQFGYSREELLHQPIEMLVPPDLQSDHALFRTAFMQQPSHRRMGGGRELHALAKDGTLVPVEISLSPATQAGRVGAVATIIDISERKNLEWRAQMLSREVQHRSRNLLTVVQALAQRMLPPDESRRLNEVLTALARTHELFGTAATGSLRAIVEGELLPFRDQCDISVCDLLVTAKAGQDVTLIIHELATNAVKYGALAVPAGRVAISGIMDEQGFRFSWQESGGPVVAPPRRRGLGTTILEDVAKGFGAEVSLNFDPGGFRYELVAPLESLSNIAPIHARPQESVAR
jgi:PAS domain S-box-containing protein